MAEDTPTFDGATRGGLDGQVERKIVHCDADSFFASVEIRDNPKLAGRPVAVGGSGVRGVVATCNYEARKYGVRSAMPGSQAVRLCPDLIFVTPAFDKYREASAQIRAIYERYTAIIEPLSLDEAYLDVSGTELCQCSATLVAREIRDAVRSEVGLTISAGIAPNKFIAKIASDWNKPDGQFTVRPQDVDAFVAALPVEKLFGVGGATAKKLHAMGIATCRDLREIALTELVRRFGKFGSRLYQLSRGIDDRPVKVDRLRKSVSVECTYGTDLPDLDSCIAASQQLLIDLQRRVERAGVTSRIDGCFIKMRFSGFETTTAAGVTRSLATAPFRELIETAWSRAGKPVRLLGLGVKVAAPDVTTQLPLFAIETDER